MKVKAFVVGGFIAAAALATPGVASAALSECASGNMCLWGNNDFKWKIGDRRAGSADIANLTGDANNEMDSWANRHSSYTGCMFGSANGTGDRQTMRPNSNDNNVSPANSDEVSSWRTRHGC